MKYLSSEHDDIVVAMSIDEIRALLDIVNEFSDGPFALSDEQWDSVMTHPRDVESELLGGLASVIDIHDAKK